MLKLGLYDCLQCSYLHKSKLVVLFLKLSSLELFYLY